MILRAAIGFVLLALVFVPFERLRPVRRGQRFFRPGFRTDLLHFLLTGTLTTIGLLLLAIPFVTAIRVLTPDALRASVTTEPAWLLSSPQFHHWHPSPFTSWEPTPAPV